MRERGLTVLLYAIHSICVFVYCTMYMAMSAFDANEFVNVGPMSLVFGTVV